MKQLCISFRGSSRVGVSREKISGMNFASVQIPRNSRTDDSTNIFSTCKRYGLVNNILHAWLFIYFEWEGATMIDVLALEGWMKEIYDIGYF